MSTEVEVPVLPYSVSVLTIDDAMEIAMWRTPGPWAVQDSLEPPRPDEGFWAIRDADEKLIGYCAFGEQARSVGLPGTPGTLDVALGMNPRYHGRHLGAPFAEAAVAHAQTILDNRTLRATVPSWNAVGRHTAEAVGFRLVGTHEVRGGRSVTTFYVYEM